MIEFKDYDPANPFQVTCEKHIICNGKITLNYAPLKGSVSIDELVEDTSGTLPVGSFFINYGDANNYRTADQIVHFNRTYDGVVVSVNYQGVSTLLRATHMNEIKEFIERGASELAARIIAEHEQNMVDQWEALLETHCEHLVAAIKEAGSGGIPRVAGDDEADSALDEYFEGDVTETGDPSIVASDDEAEKMLDEIFPDEN